MTDTFWIVIISALGLAIAVWTVVAFSSDPGDEYGNPTRPPKADNEFKDR